MKPGVVIVGAGLAGSILASKLRARHAVTVIDLCDTPAALPTPIVDTGVPSRMNIHAGRARRHHEFLVQRPDRD